MDTGLLVQLWQGLLFLGLSTMTKISFIKSLALLSAIAFPMVVQAMGGPSGPTVKFNVQGHLGEIIVNPYEIAPLTAIIRNGGYQIKNAHVTIEPKIGVKRFHIMFLKEICSLMAVFRFLASIRIM